MVYDAVDNRAHRSWQTIWVPDRDDDDNYFSNREERTRYLVKKYSHLLTEDQVRSLRGESNGVSSAGVLLWLTDRNLSYVAEDIVRD